jgi:hypothetical protein
MESVLQAQPLQLHLLHVSTIHKTVVIVRARFIVEYKEVFQHPTVVFKDTGKSFGNAPQGKHVSGGQETV